MGLIAMQTSPLMALYDRESHPSYEIRVRGTKELTFLWGSNGITKDLTFDKPLVLHIRNDLMGEVISLGTQVASKTKKNLGTLQPGECVSIPVQAISGVFATCKLESVVACLIRQS
jgi:hypothetical protein